MTRVSPRAGVEESWAPARRDGASCLNQAGALVGLHDLRRGLGLDLNPIATAAVNGSPAAVQWDYGWSQLAKISYLFGLQRSPHHTRPVPARW